MIMGDTRLICESSEVKHLHFNVLLAIMSQRNGEKFSGNTTGWWQKYFWMGR